MNHNFEHHSRSQSWGKETGIQVEGERKREEIGRRTGMKCEREKSPFSTDSRMREMLCFFLLFPLSLSSLLVTQLQTEQQTHLHLTLSFSLLDDLRFPVLPANLHLLYLSVWCLFPAAWISILVSFFHRLFLTHSFQSPNLFTQMPRIHFEWLTLTRGNERYIQIQW